MERMNVNDNILILPCLIISNQEEKKEKKIKILWII